MKPSTRMPRRSFLGASLAGAATMVARRSSAAPKARGERPPNVILIMSDEHNVFINGCYGNRLAQTPHLDRLAAEGVAFDCAYTNSPLCVPARMAFTAGKYIHRTSAWSNACWLPSPDYPSIARAMTDAGYEAFLCGSDPPLRLHRDRREHEPQP